MDFDFNPDEISEEKGYRFKNQDYNLQSPLIPTILEFVRKPEVTPFKFKSIVYKILTFLSIVNVKRNQVDSNNLFHSVFGHISSYDYLSIGFGQKFLNVLQRKSDLTFWVVSTFVRNIYKREVKNYDLSKVPESIIKYLEYFMILHVLILICNGNVKEYSNIKRGFSWTRIRVMKTKKLVDPIIEVTMPDPFGTIYINSGYFYFKNYNMLINRDCVLMMKDVYLARFQSLFSYLYRNDENYNLDTYNLLDKLYKKGDLLLRKYGSPVYKVFTMVEPICNLFLGESARKLRPRIPEFRRFRNHITKSMDELEKKFPGCIEIYHILSRVDNYHNLLAVFSSFRHWGHPFIDYKIGVQELFERLTKKRLVNDAYANKLASNLAKKIITSYFRKYKEWPLDKTMRSSIPEFLYKFVEENKWPSSITLERLGFKWHKLPIKKIFDIPESIPPQDMLADKSHSVTRTEFLKCLTGRGEVSRRVLDTYRQVPATNYREFLKGISENSLDDEDCIIGLCAKEKELKEKGRYFALMSWKMREYFVSTEYLIKTHILKYFNGITMADDQSKLVKKMLQTTLGQGRNDYERITFANHIDYEKWCNSQSLEATTPVFTVMGQLFGMPDLFAQTHKIFQNSWVYYKHRLDLIKINNEGRPENKDPHTPVFVNSIRGGLEGLRQKGWSVLSLLVIEEEMSKGPTNVKVLAQGDNQVICINFKLSKNLNEDELDEEISRICAINNKIIKNMEEGIKKMGMTPNEDETMTVSEWLVYGKIPVYRGQIYGLEPKRWSRVNTVTNDQIPTLGNIMSSASSNALTVSMYASSPISSMCHYNFVSNFVVYLTDIYNILLEDTMAEDLSKINEVQEKTRLTKLIYLDPSLGGIGGTSLTRFMMRGFPDPISESISFWKFLYKHTNDNIERKICITAGYPKLANPSIKAFVKLVENPQSLNLLKGFDGTSYVKKQVRKALFKTKDTIKNTMLKNAIEHHVSSVDAFVSHLASISPLFPRFISNFFNATWFGTVEGFIRLFERSKTLINVLGGHLSQDIGDKLKETEKSLYSEDIYELTSRDLIWKCSRIWVDELRRKSWGTKVIGATIPHPLELLEHPIKVNFICPGCCVPNDLTRKNYVSVTVPNGICNYETSRGTLKAYLGSKTAEDTTIIRPYDKDYDDLLVKKSVDMLKIINWVTKADSNVAKTILNNIKAQTGRDMTQYSKLVKVSGNYCHRMFSNRQSAGGYCNQSVNKLTRMSVSPDHFNNFDFEDGTFMFQSLMLYAQHVIGEIHDGDDTKGIYHFHVSCPDCLEEVKDILLESPSSYEFSSVINELEKWRVSESLMKMKETINLKKSKYWETMTPMRKSYVIGFNQGTLYSILHFEDSEHKDDNSIFPLTLRGKLDPLTWYNGLFHGIFAQSCLEISTMMIEDETEGIFSRISYHVNNVIDSLMSNSNFLGLTSTEEMMIASLSRPHKAPASYPLTTTDAASLQISLLRYILYEAKKSKFVKFKSEDLVIFPDISEIMHQALFKLGIDLSNIMIKNRFIWRQIKPQVIKYSKLYSEIKTGSLNEDQFKILSKGLHTIECQLRVVAREEIKPNISFKDYASLIHITKEPNIKVTILDLEEISTKPRRKPIVPRIVCPLISGLRWVQLATGSFWKINSIIENLNLSYVDFIGAGDGSGGICSLLARKNLKSKFIFNSLLELDDVDLKGSEPRPPSAIAVLGPSYSSRCVNFSDCWSQPSDLTKLDTWKYFVKCKDKYKLSINFMTLDMEMRDLEGTKSIALNLNKCSDILFDPDTTIIFKTYYEMLFDSDFMNILSSSFKKLQVAASYFSSSFTSEVYLILRDVKVVKKVTGYIDSYQVESNSFWLCPALRSVSFELRRARYVLSKINDVSYPANLLSNFFIEVEQQMRDYKISLKIIHISLELLSRVNNKDWFSLWFAICISASYSVFNSLKITKGLHITPSRTTMQKLINIYMAVHYFYSMIWDDPSLFNYLNETYRNRFTLFTTVLKIKIKDKIIGSRLVWNLTRKHEVSNRYSLSISDQNSKCANWIRLMARSFYMNRIDINKCEINFENINKYINILNDNLNIKKVEQTSDWLRLIKREKLPKIYTKTYGEFTLDADDDFDDSPYQADFQ